MTVLRRNSKLHKRLGPNFILFLEHAAGAINRIFPHVEVSTWREGGPRPTECYLTSENYKLEICILIGEKDDDGGVSLTATVTRKSNLTLDRRELDICKLTAQRISTVLANSNIMEIDQASMSAMSRSFDEDVVAEHIKKHHKLELDIALVFRALHTLSEQSYENKSLTFGCLIDSKDKTPPSGFEFPSEFLISKKYKALSDGFRTAYLISAKGKVLNFVNLDRYRKGKKTIEQNFPDWAEQMANASRVGRCGISLNRQGEILVFEEGTLRFSYRFGSWQYWNHSQVIEILRRSARVQKVPPAVVGQVVGSIYRAALDISFRRTGAMFVIIRRRQDLHELVRHGDALADAGRSHADSAFDGILRNRKIQFTPRGIAAELASLDGSIVIENIGTIVAYGAILQPKKIGRLKGTEGSRTKAAIGASNYGLALKVSADGDICVYQSGKLLLRV